MQGSLPRDNKGVIIDPKHSTDWIVPRRVMCAFFWIGIVLLFTGVILLVTGRHKGKVSNVYQSWGGILLGLGFCLLLICLILCLHAYCVITITEDQPQTRKNIPPPAPVMANGKKPRERSTGSGKPVTRASLEPVNLLIIEREDVGPNSKSYDSMGSTGRRGAGDQHGNHNGAAGRQNGRHGHQGNGIIPNGPVAHPVTLVGTLTNNTASVSRGLPPLLEDENNSVSTENGEDLGLLGHSPTPSPRNQSPNVIAHNKSMNYSKDGMTIRSNPLDSPFPSEDIIQNVDNDARLIQNDLSSNNLENKVQNISGVTSHRKTRSVQEIPNALYATPRKTKQSETRSKSVDELDQKPRRPESVSSVHNIPLENVNPEIKKFMDRVGFNPEIENNVGGENKHLNIKASDEGTQTVSEKENSSSSNRQQGGPYSDVEGYTQSIQTNSIAGTPQNRSNVNAPQQRPTNIIEPQYAVVNKHKSKSNETNVEISKGKASTVTEPPEKATPPRSPNSIEFHRRMQKILEKQELEKQKRSPRGEKKNSLQSEQSSSPGSFRQQQLNQNQQLLDSESRMKNLQAMKLQIEQAKSNVEKSSKAMSPITSGRSPTNHIQDQARGQTTVSSPLPIDSGIYAKINPTKNPALLRPQPVTYCTHCGSGHVTTEIPGHPVTQPKAVAKDACVGNSKFVSIESSGSPVVERKPDIVAVTSSGAAAQYSWSDTTGTVVRAGARPKTSTTETLTSSIPKRNVDLNVSDSHDQVLAKPPPGPNSGKITADQAGIILPPPPPPSVARGKIAVTTAALLKQMQEEQQKAVQASAGGQGSAAGAAFDPSAALQQILLKQAVAHHHGRDVRRFSNPKVVYLGPDMEVTASKVSIYDNVQYVWKDDHDPN